MERGWKYHHFVPLLVEDVETVIPVPDCPSDAFATAASPSWVTGRAVAGRGIAPIRGVAVAGGGTGKGTGIVD